MAYDFSTLTTQMALALIEASGDPLIAAEGEWLPGRPDTVLSSGVRKFLAGDHWQDGDGWVGPKPMTKAGVLDDTFMNLVRERFTSRNMLSEITTRHNDGVVGREPVWGFTVVRPLDSGEEPDDAEQKQIDTIEAAMTTWWNKRQGYQLFQRVTPEMIISGRAVIRLFVPAARLAAVPGVFDETVSSGNTNDTSAGAATDQRAPAPASTGPRLVGGVTVDENQPDENTITGVYAATLEDALDHIYIEVVIADDAAIYTDMDSMEQVGIVRYREQGQTPGTLGPLVVETTYLDGDASVPHADRNTVIRIVTADVSETPVSLPLGGRLMHYAAMRPPLLSHQLVSLQKALNLAVTMLPRNVETSGFRERIISNAQLPGEWVLDADGNKTGAFKLGEWQSGPGTTMFVSGQEVTQEDTTKSVMTPGVTIVEPAPVSPTVEAMNAVMYEMLREAKQAHILGTDQAISGISRQQARADFGKSLGRTQAALEPAGRWLLETALALAAVFATDTGGVDVTLFRCDFNCMVDTGPLDPREITGIMDAAAKGFVSTEYAMEQLGVEDTDAELARMNAEPGKRNALRQALLVTLKAGVDAGLTLPVAAELAGFDQKDIDLITKDALANPIPAPAPLFNADGTPVQPAPGAPGAPPGGAPGQQPAPVPPNAPPPPAAPPVPPRNQKPAAA